MDGHATMAGHAAAALLGVSERADLTTIRAAYRARARATHPDFGGDPVEFSATLDAFSLLARNTSVAPAAAALPPRPMAIGATHGFDGYDSRPPVRTREREIRFADVLAVALARECAAPRR